MKATLLFLFLTVPSFLGCHQVRLRSASPEVIARLQGNLLFRFGRWVLSPDQEKIVREKVMILKREKEIAVVLEGHTDRIGPEEFNLQLGDRRARKVRELFVRGGVDPGQLVVISYGEKRPLVKGRTVRELQPNRRVEVKVR